MTTDCPEAGVAGGVRSFHRFTDSGGSTGTTDTLAPPQHHGEEAPSVRRLCASLAAPSGHGAVRGVKGPAHHGSGKTLFEKRSTASGEQDPLRAAFDALWSGAVAFGGRRHGVLFDEVRQVFPEHLRARDLNTRLCAGMIVSIGSGIRALCPTRPLGDC